MDNNPNKRNRSNSPVINSPNKIKKVDWKQESNVIDNKMVNIAKLRQQFVEEIKDIELSLNESIKTLQNKISEIDKKNVFMTEKLRQANKVLYNQSETIYNKEKENKVISEKVEELYEYQKSIVENIEDISNTLNSHENFSEQLASEYDTIILMQLNHNNALIEELQTIQADEVLPLELDQIKLKIKEQEEEIKQEEILINNLELEIKTQKSNNQEYQKRNAELEQKLNKVEAENLETKLNANVEKNKLLDEINKLDKEFNLKINEIKECDKKISEFQAKIRTMSNNKNSIEEKIVKVVNNKNSLLKENEDLKKTVAQSDQTNNNIFEKLAENLKSSQNELSNRKQSISQATNILQKKVVDLTNKLKSYESIESKLKTMEIEMKKEEELIMQINMEQKSKKEEYDKKMKDIDTKKNKIKANRNQGEERILQLKADIELIEKEEKELNEKLKTKLKTVDEELFHSEEEKNKEKQKNRRKLYTPTVADDDLEIDSLTIDEQLTHLTQSNTSGSESPDKAKKFFKHSLTPQNKSRKENYRGRGRAKKYL